MLDTLRCNGSEVPPGCVVFKDCETFVFGDLLGDDDMRATVSAIGKRLFEDRLPAEASFWMPPLVERRAAVRTDLGGKALAGAA